MVLKIELYKQKVPDFVPTKQYFHHEKKAGKLPILWGMCHL